MKAIETRYKGYRFRSRLEARWAVFFDRLELDWQYEPEGFDLGQSGYYLPDFKVFTPQGEIMWYEIKARNVEYNEKFFAFRNALEKANERERDGHFYQGPEVRANLLSGDPLTVFSDPEMAICLRCGFISVPAYGFYVYPDDIIIGCQPCDYETPCGGYHPEEPGILGLPVSPHKGMIISREPIKSENYALSRKPVLTDAIHWLHDHAIEARSARFEHGEAPSLSAR